MKLPTELIEQAAECILKESGVHRAIDYSEYMWMGEEQEEFDRRCIEDLIEEEFLESCMEELLDEEEEACNMLLDCPMNLERLAQDLDELVLNGEDVLTSEHLQRLVLRSRLNPEAAEFVPSEEDRGDPNGMYGER